MISSQNKFDAIEKILTFFLFSELVIDPNDNGEADEATEAYDDIDDFYDDGVFHQTPAVAPADNNVTFLCNNETEKFIK